MDSVLTYHMKCTCLSSCVDIIIVTIDLNISSVEKMQFIFIHQRRTGINSMTVIRRIRIKRNTLIFPVHQILTCIMSPELQSALYFERCILEKYMIFSLKPAQPIGIIQPAHRRHQVMPQPVSAFGQVCSFFHFCYISLQNLR